jgi:hypothetical protein
MNKEIRGLGEILLISANHPASVAPKTMKFDI